ncbi:latrophilin Cirl-like isoform X5 [Varroa destructor]|uniref:Latrophilin Cirl n=1 Tax=Varroa destructor TaxID=109461 RepID=A0A7M7JTJ1_VARDE|nr:latrophilin Cirl-like isoform X5 [Varroa destructor]
MKIYVRALFVADRRHDRSWSLLRASDFQLHTISAEVPNPPVTPSPRNRDRIQYKTEYACEGGTLNISCKDNYNIHLVRANYGRLSVSICNPLAKIDMSVNCMSWKSHLIMEKKCMNKQSCSVQVSAKNFDDPCPGTIKYLEVQYNCTLASLAVPSTTTPLPTLRNTTAASAEEDSASTSSTTTTVAPVSSTTRVAPSASTAPPEPAATQFENEAIAPEPPKSFPTEESADPVDYDGTGTGGNQPTGKMLYCEPRTSRGLHWNWTRAGNVHVQKCPGGATGYARWHCDALEGHWYPSKPDLKQCKSLWVESLMDRLAKEESLTQLASDLKSFTNNKEIFSTDVKEISKLMQGMLSRLGSSGVDHTIDMWHREQIYKELLLEFVATMSNLLEEKHQEAWADLNPAEQKQILTRLMTALEENAVLLSDTFTQETNYPVVKNNILMSVRAIDSWRNMNVYFPSIADRERDQNWSAMQDSILLPIEAIQQFYKQSSLRRLIFVAYNNLDTFLVPEPEGRFPRPTFDNLANGFINSRIVSASIGHQGDNRLALPLQVTLRHLQEGLLSDPQCVYWNTNSDSWSSEGCWVQSSNRSYTICTCDHLGNFAVLMEGPAQNDAAQKPFDQRLVVTIGCCVTLGFCCIAFLLLFLLKLHKTDQLWVHRNLALNLLLSEFIFVVGINQTHQNLLCSVVAALLQYFLLVSLTWTFFEGFHVYNSLVEPMEIHKSKLRCYAILAYVPPAIVTAISMLIDPSSFGTPKYCWLRSDNYFIFSFIAPMVGIIFGCVVFVCISVCILCNQGGLATSVKGKEEDKVHAVRSYLYWISVLLVFMTFTWASSVVYVAKFNMTWAIIFAVFNSLLGLFLLIFTCWKNEAFQDRYGHTLANSRWLPNCLKRCLFGGRNQLAIDVSVNSGNGAPLHVRIPTLPIPAQSSIHHHTSTNPTSSSVNLHPNSPNNLNCLNINPGANSCLGSNPQSHCSLGQTLSTGDLHPASVAVLRHNVHPTAVATMTTASTSSPMQSLPLAGAHQSLQGGSSLMAIMASSVATISSTICPTVVTATAMTASGRVAMAGGLQQASAPPFVEYGSQSGIGAYGAVSRPDPGGSAAASPPSSSAASGRHRGNHGGRGQIYNTCSPIYGGQSGGQFGSDSSSYTADHQHRIERDSEQRDGCDIGSGIKRHRQQQQQRSSQRQRPRTFYGHGNEQLS